MQIIYLSSNFYYTCGKEYYSMNQKGNQGQIEKGGQEQIGLHHRFKIEQRDGSICAHFRPGAAGFPKCRRNRLLNTLTSRCRPVF